MCEKISDIWEAINKNIDIIQITITQDLKENIDSNISKEQDEDEENYILWLA